MTTTDFNNSILQLNDKLYVYALSLTSNSDDAKDLLQDTFLKAYSNKEKLKEDSNVKAWAYTIMRNTFINNYRRSRISNTIIDYSNNLYMLNNSNKDASSCSETKYNHSEIVKEINKLDIDQRSLFQQHLEGYKYKELAKEHNLPLGTVKSKIFLTRKKLAENLSDYKN